MVALVGCLLLLPIGVGAAQKWLTFQSTEHFSIEVPADWDHGALHGKDLEMYDSKNAWQKAVMVADKHAFIFAVRNGPTQADIDAEVKRGDAEIERIKKFPASVAAGGCESLTEVDTRNWTRVSEDLRKPRSARAYIQNGAMFFCQGRNKSVTVSIEFWEGDPRERLYRDVVLHMAQSIRFTP